MVKSYINRGCEQVIAKSSGPVDLSGSGPFLLGKYLIRLEQPLSPLSILNWLRNQQSDTQIYWTSRTRDLEIGAVGLLDSVDSDITDSLAQALSIIESRLNQTSSGIRYYGGHCFDPEKLDLAAWNGLGSYRFVLPEYEIIRNGDDYTLAWNHLSDSHENNGQIEQQFHKYIKENFTDDHPKSRTPLEAKTKNPFVCEDVPSEAEWTSAVGRLTDAIKNGEVEKVVLARRIDLVFALHFDPYFLFESVKRQFTQAYSFLFRFPEAGIFFGCSPECLFEKAGRDLFTEAVAGTRPIAADFDENRKLQEELFQSSKERREHAFVTDTLQAELKSFCRQIVAAESSEIIDAGSVQHLLTRFRAKLADKTDLHRIISTLSPTAAVNGVPSEKAMELIRSQEPFSRGWYAGSVGWITADSAQFATAIRSALIRDRRTVSVYAGAGLVRDSNPQAEWQETEHKLKPILAAAQKISC